MFYCQQKQNSTYNIIDEQFVILLVIYIYYNVVLKSIKVGNDVRDVLC